MCSKLLLKLGVPELCPYSWQLAKSYFLTTPHCGFCTSKGTRTSCMFLAPAEFSLHFTALQNIMFQLSTVGNFSLCSVHSNYVGHFEAGVPQIILQLHDCIFVLSKWQYRRQRSFQDILAKNMKPVTLWGKVTNDHLVIHPAFTVLWSHSGKLILFIIY